MQLTLLCRTGAFCELVEDVETSLVPDLSDYTSLFEQVIGDLSADRLTHTIEHDLEVFSLSRSASPPSEYDVDLRVWRNYHS
jgi:hypothetical protein